jgi:hypothetical protein
MRPITQLHPKGTVTKMHLRTRKLIGAIALLAMITIYSLLAMAVAIILQVNQAGPTAEFAYYVFAGLLWVLPAGYIIWWMQQSPRMAERS